MTSNVVTLEANHPLERVCPYDRENFRHMPVCEGKELQGMFRARCAQRGHKVQQSMPIERYITGGGR
jgi:hypothetical protein